eukprot:TRINITY_DN648_c0_g2_i1.p1 TRINITY_DN648_c0_g2~~TRINITY_DN648_c0_g2_i1.p1  ORF type:complete len:735 (+),score=133.47 TRINITY_DN648_c0_g2_i1:48-2252(+)
MSTKKLNKKNIEKLKQKKKILSDPSLKKKKPKQTTSYSTQLKEKGSLTLSFESPLVKYSILGVVFLAAYFIRLGAVYKYGRIIHEFDPWFNFRATQYLVDNGWEKFSTWFDYESWYPIGRPVGTTLYPGMMVTAAVIFRIFEFLGLGLTLNDVCVFIPAGFAIFTCYFTYLLAKEVSNSEKASLLSAGVMAILPAHLMRSVAGGYDNECIAMAAIACTFYFWVRANRDTGSWYYGIPCGISYVYMVSTWGAYPFVLNMIGVHTGVLILMGRYTSSLHRAYSLFFIIGTLGAIQFPIVGLQPLKSMEQIGPLAVFFGIQFLEIAEFFRGDRNEKEHRKLQLLVLSIGVALGALVLAFVVPEGYFGPLGARIRGLFIPHTKTGNPLVDSVAEHRATQLVAYIQFFHLAIFWAIGGFYALVKKPVSNSKVFLICYAVASAYFSRKMVRLILLLAPPVAILTGIGFTTLAELLYRQMKEDEKNKKEDKTNFVLIIMLIGTLVLLGDHSIRMATVLSEPQVVTQIRDSRGDTIIADDFREAYWWLRDNTPEDSRVMAWWDYGYQINGIANRTTIADGNTWNHEHIALLGKCLVSEPENAHPIIRHMADYILVWSTRHGGLWGDDLAKMPHMVRIAGSVYPDIEDPNEYFLDQQGNPSPKMRDSLLYKLHSYRFDRSITLEHFSEVFTSEHNLVRVFKVENISEESKNFVNEHHTYPPALDEVLKMKTDFDREKNENRII